MIFAGAPAAARPTRPRSSFLQVPEMIKLGETWKFVELPRAVDPEKPVVASASGIRAAIFDAAGPAPQRDEAMDAALKALADYDNANAQAPVERRQERPGAVPRRPDPAPERDRQGRQGRRGPAQLQASRSSTAWSRPTRPGSYPKGRQGARRHHRRGHEALLVRGLPPHRRRVRACGTRSRAATSWPTRRSGWPSSRAS